MPRSIRYVAFFLGIVTPAFTVSCALEETVGGWSGTVVDSAGITIVINTPGPNLPRFRSVIELTIGQLDGPDEYTFGRITDVAADRHGRILVVDQLAREIRRYSPHGGFLDRMGGPGEGPGEFSARIWFVHVAADDSIYVPDNSQRRVNIFAPDGTFGRTINLAPFPGLLRNYRLNDGRLLIHCMSFQPGESGAFVPSDALLSVNSDAQADTVMIFDYEPSDYGDMDVLRVPLIPNAAFYDVLPGERIAWSAVERTQVAIHTIDGRLERLVRSTDWTRRETTRRDASDLESAYRRGSNRPDGPIPESIVFPDSMPIMTSIRATPDGGFWVQRMAPPEAIDPAGLRAPGLSHLLGGIEWDMFSAEGLLIGAVVVPPGVRITRITSRSVFGIAKDELDVERAVRLTLPIPQS